MTKWIVVDGEGEEHTEPIGDREKAKEVLAKARKEGTLDYRLKRTGRGFM